MGTADRPSTPRTARARLVAEFNALWGLDLATSEPPPGGLDGPVADLEVQLAAALGRQAGPQQQALRALLTALASDREQPLASLAADLAEILFVARARRSEYRDHLHPWRPYRIDKLLLEYACLARRIDDLQAALTKDFCAQRCTEPPVGCCHILGYDLGLVPDRMLALQRLEARWRGWVEPACEDKCRYHTARGCVLVLFKSPACIGHLCDRLLDWLGETHPARLLDPFLADLAAFRNSDLDRERIFAAGQALIDSGHRLLEKTPGDAHAAASVP